MENSSVSSPEMSYVPLAQKAASKKKALLLVFSLLIFVAAIVIAAFLLLSKSPAATENTPISSPVEQSKPIPSFPIKVEDPHTEADSAGEQTEKGISFEIKNADSSSVKLTYPEGWTVKTFNNKKTYSFISPSGSAFGYDFSVYDGMLDCGTNRSVEVQGIGNKYKRYYDTATSGVNWYICYYHQGLGKFMIDNSRLFTIYALNNEDLVKIDSIISSIEEISPASSSFTGKIYNMDFKYNNELGTASSITGIMSFGASQNIETDCKTESIHFSSNTSINLNVSTGHCEGGFGGEANIFRVYSKDGKIFFFTVQDLTGTGSPYKYNITGRQDVSGTNTYSSGIQGMIIQIITNDPIKDKMYLENIVKSTNISLSPLKSTSFDQVRP